MSNREHRLDHLEEAQDVLRMQNRILATALKGLIHSLPADMAQDAVESIQRAFEDELDKLQYEDSPHTDLFHDVTYAFFREQQ